MGYISVNKKNIFYNSSGNGEPLILLHNGFYSTETWDKLRKKFSKYYHVIDYDRFGYGKSEKLTEALDGDILKQGVEELSSLIEQLKLKNVNICGHCLGGAIALLYAAENKKNVKKLIAESVGYFSDTKLLLKTDMTFAPYDKIPDYLKKILSRMHGNEYSKNLWEILRKYKSGYIMNPDYDITGKIRGIDCPVFLINGDRDFYFDIEHIAKARKKIKNNRLWIAPNTGHDLHIELETDFSRNVLSFLGSK